MADSNKRKERPGGNKDNRGGKRSKGGSGGKWQTSHQQAKVAGRTRGQIEPGDVGIWATCARGQERRANEELVSMLEECAERFYGLVSGSDEQEYENVLPVDDIESSIRKELSSQQTTPKLFSSVHLDIPCVLFFKTPPSLDPVDFVHRICEEIVSTPGIRRMRYINRLTPMTLIGKATEKGLEEVGNAVLGEHFKLNKRENCETSEESREEQAVTAPHPSYAIRPTIRNHNTLKRDAVIKQIALSISDMHKVDLTTPSKVILVEIYTSVCGMGVVGSDWESLKRFNLAELYQPTTTGVKAQAIPQSVTKDETPTSTATNSVGL